MAESTQSTSTALNRYLSAISSPTSPTHSPAPHTFSLCHLPPTPQLRRAHIIGLSYSQQLSIFSPQNNSFVDFLQRLQFQGSVMSQARSTMTRSFLSIMRGYSYSAFRDLYTWCGQNDIEQASDDFQSLLHFTSITLTLILYRLLYDLSASNIDFYIPSVWYNLPQSSIPAFDDVVAFLHKSRCSDQENAVSSIPVQQSETQSTLVASPIGASTKVDKDNVQTLLIDAALSKLPLSTSLYSLINQLKPTAWIDSRIVASGDNEDNTDGFAHGLHQVLSTIIPPLTTNLISPPNQFVPNCLRTTTNEGALRGILPIPQLPLDGLQTLPPIPPFVIFNRQDKLAKMTHYPTHIHTSSLYLRDVLVEHAHYVVKKSLDFGNGSVSGRDQEQQSPLVLTEIIANLIGINQLYTYYLGFSDFLVPTMSNSLNQDDCLDNMQNAKLQFSTTFIRSITDPHTATPTTLSTPIADSNCPFPIKFATPLYFSLLPNNIRYPPLIIAHARMGLLESTHFTFTIPPELLKTLIVVNEDKDSTQPQGNKISGSQQTSTPTQLQQSQSISSPSTPLTQNDHTNTAPEDDEIISSNDDALQMPDLAKTFMKSISSKSLNWRVFQKSGVSKVSVDFVKKLCQEGDGEVNENTGADSNTSKVDGTDSTLLDNASKPTSNRLFNHTMASMTRLKRRNNPIIKAARQEPLLLHPFALFAPTSITYTDLIQTASSFGSMAYRATGEEKCGSNQGNDGGNSNNENNNDDDDGTHHEALQTPQLAPSKSTNQSTKSLHIPLIHMAAVQPISIWGRIQQRYSLGTSQFELERETTDPEQGTASSAAGANATTAEPPNSPKQSNVAKFPRQKPTRYVNVGTGKRYNVSLYPNLATKESKESKETTNSSKMLAVNVDGAESKGIEDPTPPTTKNPNSSLSPLRAAPVTNPVRSLISKTQSTGLMQPNLRTTLIGNKATLTSILSRFTMYCSPRIKANTKPKHVNGDGVIGIVQCTNNGDQAPSEADAATAEPTVPQAQVSEALPSDDTAFPWCPETYCLPQAYPLYLVRLVYEREHRNQQLGPEPQYTTTSSPSSWILKPSTGSCGKGIRVLTFEQSVTELVEKTNLQHELQLAESLITPTNDLDISPARDPVENGNNDGEKTGPQSATLPITSSDEAQATTPFTPITSFDELITPQVFRFAKMILDNPVSAPFFIHPTLLLDLERFISTKLESFASLQDQPADSADNTTISSPQSPPIDPIQCPWCLQPNQRFVISIYLSPPFLLKDRKFDLRIYVAVSSLSPLVAWIHRLALVRVCTEPYELDDNNTISTQLILNDDGKSNQHWDELKPSTNTAGDDNSSADLDKKNAKKASRLGQLTNFSLNKFSKSFIVESLNDFDGSFDLTTLEMQEYYTAQAQTPPSSSPPLPPLPSQSLHDLLYSEIYGKATLSRLFAMMKEPYKGLSTINPSQVNVTPESLFTNISLLVTRTLLAIKFDPKLIDLYHHNAVAEGSSKNKFSFLTAPNPSHSTTKPRYDPYVNDSSYKTALGQQSSISLLGFDVMVDYKGQCWLAEVNTAPSLDCDADLDRHTKPAVVQQCMQLNSMRSFVLNQAQMKSAMTKELNKSTTVKDTTQKNDFKTSPPSPPPNHPHPSHLLTVPPSQWPIKYLQHIAAIELQSLHSQGFRRVIPSALDQSNQDLLMTKHTILACCRNNLDDQTTNNLDVLDPKLIDSMDEMVQIWKHLPEADCVAALNLFFTNSLGIVQLDLDNNRIPSQKEFHHHQVITTSSLHRNHCPDAFHPFHPHEIYLE